MLSQERVLGMPEYLEPCEDVKNELGNLAVRRYRQIHDYLYDKEEVDAATEVVVHLLLFLSLFKSHNLRNYIV